MSKLPVAGTAGKLQLQLVDTAANTGAGESIAHASVDLDMRQWKDSQTYQAEVPLANDQVKYQSASTMFRGNGCCLQNFQQDLSCIPLSA